MTVRRVILLSVVGLLAAGLAAPYLSAERFGNRIRGSLEAALGRKVEIGKAGFDLFRGPGFSLQDVVIHEDPAIGIEPFAYVSRLEASIRLISLLRGRLEFSTLRLDDPSVNLAKAEGGIWNFERLLSRTGPTSRASWYHMPAIEVRSGRLNFKFGDMKSVFYLTDADLDVWPPSGGAGDWRLRFSGGPGRTDRTAQGFGRLRGTVVWRTFSEPDPRVDADLELEQSAIAEIVALCHGHSVGVHGLVASTAHLGGPISDIQITGRLQIGDVHRWDLMPPQGQDWTVNYKGRLDLLSQRLEVETVSADAKPLPISARFRASDYLSQPHWAVAVALNRLPVGKMVQVGRHLGAPFPERLVVDGTADGVIGYSSTAGLQGKIALSEMALSDPDSVVVRPEQAELVIGADKIQLLPTTVRFDRNETAEIEGAYSRDTQALNLKISTDAMKVADFRSSARHFLGAANIPMLDNFGSGNWNGWLRYQRQGDKPGEWSGNFHLRATHIRLPGVAEPVQIASASVVLQGDRATMNRIAAKVGKVELQGDYRYVPLAARRHVMHLRIPELDGAELERLMMPSLRRQGFFARALRFGRAAVPDWLASRKIDGSLNIGAFTFGDVRVESVRTRLIWDGVDVKLMELEGHLENGTLRGRVSAHLAGSAPVYRAGVSVQSADWSDGKLDATLTARTSGIGVELWPNLRGEGFVNGRSVKLNPETEFKDFSGCYEFTMGRGTPRLRFTGVQATLEDESFFGQGATQADGRLQFDLSSGPKQLRVSGTLSPLQLDVIAGR